jgi:hypothetical protein
MEIYNKYNVGQTYYRFREGIIEEVLITRLICLINTDQTTYKYNGRYSGRFFDCEEESKLGNLFETKEECRKYAINKLLEQ